MRLAVTLTAALAVSVALTAPSLAEGYPYRTIADGSDTLFLQLSQSTFSGLAAHVVRELGSRGGLGLVLDDIGAGPTTLKQLVDLRPVAVKVDRELCAGLDRSARKQAVVRGLVQICEQLGAQESASWPPGALLTCKVGGTVPGLPARDRASTPLARGQPEQARAEWITTP